MRNKNSDSYLDVYFAQVVMNSLVDGVSYLGFWQGTTGELLVLVSPEHARKEDEKVYSFEACPDETQEPEELAEYFQDFVWLIIRNQASNHEVPNSRFPELR